MKKVLLILLVPILAISGFLFGCGEKDRTKEEVKILIEQMMDSYIVTTGTGENAVTKNRMFGYHVNKFETRESNDDIGEGRASLEYIMNVSFVNAGLTPDNELKRDELNLVYNKLLALIFNYYQNWQASFYANTELVDISKNEINELYEKAAKLKTVLESFDAARLELERTFSLFGNSSMLSAYVNVFNIDFNNLIEASLSFMNYFELLHSRYITNVNVGHGGQRLVDAVLLKLAHVVYLHNVKSLQINGKCDLDVAGGLIEKLKLSNNSTITDYENLIIKSFLGKEGAAGDLIKPDSIKPSDLEDEISFFNVSRFINVSGLPENEILQKQNQLDDLHSLYTSFNQYFGIYNKVYSQVNMFEYNNKVFTLGKDLLIKYKANLSAKDRANLNIITDFASFKCVRMVNVLLEVVR